MINKTGERAHFDQQVSGKGNEIIFYDTPFLQRLVADIENFAISQLGDLSGKKLLYFGCGVNIKPVKEFTNRGAISFMIDISPKSIDILNAKINELGISDRVFPIIMDCENLIFSEGEFDAIYGRAILHHLNLKKAIDEIYRVLKKGGCSVFIEPLGMNPMLNLYRKLTPKRRTTSERPFNKEELKYFSNAGFSQFDHYEFTLFSQAGIILNSILKINNRDIISYKRLKRLDDLILPRLTFLKRFCWNTVLVLRK